jgi:hypothetical protein
MKHTERLGCPPITAKNILVVGCGRTVVVNRSNAMDSGVYAERVQDDRKRDVVEAKAKRRGLPPTSENYVGTNTDRTGTVIHAYDA